MQVQPCKSFPLFSFQGTDLNIVGVFNGEGPPVPIPNTEVKLTSADNTCLETDREDSSSRILNSKSSTSRTTRELVFLAQRVHLFPFRTQKLSSAEATILAWRRAGKIAQCQHYPVQLTRVSRLAVLVFIPHRCKADRGTVFLLSSVGRAPDC